MPATVVVGGQYGSEGKGKLVAHLSASSDVTAVVRCGGPNSGHTVDVGNSQYALQQLPSGAINDECHLYLSAGMIVDPSILWREMSDLLVDPTRLHVDRNAVILDESDRTAEANAALGRRIGSTLSGTGSAVARRALRDPSQYRAADCEQLQAFVTNVSLELNDQVDNGQRVIVEGTQGSGLSLLHSSHFPFVTSRETSVSGFLSEVGLAPSVVDEVYLVLRTFPIRVAGNSGPLSGELSWETLTSRCGSPIPLRETTTVTRNTRRLGEFDWDQALESVRLNRPSKLAVHGLDYIDYENRAAQRWDNLTESAKRFVSKLECRLGVPADILFTGPSLRDIVDLRDHKQGGEPGRQTQVLNPS